MARTRITIALEVDESVDVLEGRARHGDGPWHGFHGWLGLAEAIHALAAASARSAAAPSGASRRQKVDPCENRGHDANAAGSTFSPIPAAGVDT